MTSVHSRMTLAAAVMFATWNGVAVASDPAEGTAPSPAAQAPAADPEWRHAWVGSAGVGYYERVHLGVAYLTSPATSLGVFGGWSSGQADASTWAAGLTWSHRLWGSPERLEAGLDAKAMYWEQSSPDYHWSMMTLGFGGYLAREFTPGWSIALDAGVALSFDVGVTRKQNVNYEYPTRWNASVCLELRYRFYQW